MTVLPKNLSCYLPWVFTVPLLMIAYGLGVYFRGTDNVLFMPTIVSLMGFFLFAVLPGVSKGWQVPRSSVFVLTLLFWLYMSLSVFWSSVPYNSVFFALIIGILPLLFAAFVLAQEPVKWLKVHGVAMGGAALGLSVWALIQFFFFYEEYGPRIHHPMLNPNNLAVLFNMALFPLLALFMQVRKSSHILLLFGGIMLVFMALLVTQSRGALLAFAISFLPFIWVCRRSGTENFLKSAVFIVSAVLAFLIVDHFSAGLLEKNILQIGKGFELASAVDRLELWKSTWEMIKDHPWLGTGLGTFYYYYPAYRSTIDRSDGFFVHMDPLQFWQETGVLAPVLFYALLIAVLWVTVKAVRKLPKDAGLRLWIMAPFSGLLALAGHTHITFHLYILIVMVPAGYLLALWFVATEKALGEKRKMFCLPSGKGRKGAVIILIVSFLFVSVWLGRAAYATHLINEANILMNANRLEEGHDLVKKASFIAPDIYSRPYEYEAKYRLALLWTNTSGLSAEERKMLYQEALSYINEAIKRNSGTTHLWNQKVMILFMGRDFNPQGEDEAIALLNKTLKANPMLLDARMGLAQIYKSQGETRKALAVLEGGIGRFVPKSRNSVNFYVEIARLRLQLGDQKGHDQMMRAAAEFARRYNLISQ